jgi:DNA-binding transcriptional LysR family regulator
MRYDLTDLKLFIYIGETLNLTRSAEKIFLSLPAASARVKNLEDSLKVRLLNRQATGVTMTPAGDVLYRYAKAVFYQLEQMHSELQPFSEGVKGRLRVLANASATYSFMTEVLTHFLQDNPEVDIALEEKTNKEVLAAIRAGTADLGIVSGNLDLTGFDYTPLFSDSLVALIYQGHALNQRDSVDFAELIEDYQFVGISPESVLQSFLEARAHELGRRLHQRVYVGSFDVVARLVAAQIGIAIIPWECAKRLNQKDKLQILPLNDEWAKRDRYICRLPGRDLPHYAERFIESVEAVIKQIHKDFY